LLHFLQNRDVQIIPLSNMQAYGLSVLSPSSIHFQFKTDGVIWFSFLNIFPGDLCSLILTPLGTEVGVLAVLNNLPSLTALTTVRVLAARWSAPNVAGQMGNGCCANIFFWQTAPHLYFPHFFRLADSDNPSRGGTVPSLPKASQPLPTPFQQQRHAPGSLPTTVSVHHNDQRRLRLDQHMSNHGAYL